jgi:hypothetical protein
MDVRGVDSGPTGTELSSALRGPPELKEHGHAGLPILAQSDDTITATLSELSSPAAVKFLERLEQPPHPEMAARLDDLIRASVSAVAEGNVQQALARLGEFAALSPRRTSTARMDAELRLEHATHLLQAADTAAH